MARYEVFVPAAPPKVPMDLTLRLEAEHWLGALKTGLQRLGDTAPANNVLCDIQADGSIHVTDPDSGRVFRIVELPAAPAAAPAPAAAVPAPVPAPAAPALAAPAPAAPVAPAHAAPPPAQPAPQPPVREPPAPAPAPKPAPAPRQAAAPPPAEPPRAPPPTAPAPPAPAPAPPPAAAAKPAPKPTRRPSGHAEHVVETKTPISTPAHPIGRLTPSSKAEDVLADLFLEVSDLGRVQDRQVGLGFLLDTAMRVIGCEAGSVFIADLGRADLSFAVVRGPIADKLMALAMRVPIGVGIVGFCAQENVCLAVSDAEKDSRFYRAVSEATGYQTRSILCAPMARHGQVVGCLEVLNKKGARPFDQKDLAVLSYLAAQAAVFLGRFDA